MAKEQDDILNEVTEGEYKYGFVSDVETEMIGKGLNESVIRLISQKKEEPEWMLEFRSFIQQLQIRLQQSLHQKMGPRQER